MSGSAKKWATTPSFSSLWWPWIAPSPLCLTGPIVGIDSMSGRVAYLDLYDLKTRDIIEAMEVWLFGQRNTGKSAFMKSYFGRNYAYQCGLGPDGEPAIPSGRANDSKPLYINPTGEESEKIYVGGEWGPTIKNLYGNIYNMAAEGDINPFDLSFGTSEFDIVEIAIDFAEDILERPTKRYETLAIQVAAFLMTRDYPNLASPNLLQMILLRVTSEDANTYFTRNDKVWVEKLEALNRITPEMRTRIDAQFFTDKPSNINETELREDAGQMSAVFGKLLYANYGRTFGSTNSVSHIIRDEIASINWWGMNKRAAARLRGLTARWTTIAINNGDFSVVPSMVFSDEQASELKDPITAAYEEEWARKARAFRSVNFKAAHALRDLTRVGAAGSALRSSGEALSRAIGVKMHGRQPYDEDILHDLVMDGMTEEEAFFTTTEEMIPGLWAVCIKGQPTRFIQHILVDDELDEIETNQATESGTARVPNWTADEIAHQALTEGVMQIGLN